MKQEKFQAMTVECLVNLLKAKIVKKDTRVCIGFDEYHVGDNNFGYKVNDLIQFEMRAGENMLVLRPYFPVTLDYKRICTDLIKEFTGKDQTILRRTRRSRKTTRSNKPCK